MARSVTSPAAPLGLRERKAAATRVAIVQALSARLASTALSEISADDLAADANVSRMTFFNDFPTKEHAVDQLMVHWFFRIHSEIGRHQLRGVAAIELVFRVMGDEVAAAPERMRRVFAYFASRPPTRSSPVLDRAERAALAPGAPSDEMSASLGDLLTRSVNEAAADGEIELVGSVYELAHFLGALANGSALVGHSSDETDWSALYRRHVRRALGLLGTGARPDPRPPRVPARYRASKKKRKGKGKS